MNKNQFYALIALKFWYDFDSKTMKQKNHAFSNNSLNSKRKSEYKQTSLYQQNIIR